MPSFGITNELQICFISCRTHEGSQIKSNIYTSDTWFVNMSVKLEINQLM